MPTKNKKKVRRDVATIDIHTTPSGAKLTLSLQEPFCKVFEGLDADDTLLSNNGFGSVRLATALRSDSGQLPRMAIIDALASKENVSVMEAPGVYSAERLQGFVRRFQASLATMYKAVARPVHITAEVLEETEEEEENDA